MVEIPRDRCPTDEPATFSTGTSARARKVGQCYLEDKLQFPFLAHCIADRAISPLRKGDEVEIVGMGPESECQHEMFVETRWDRRTLAVPLAQVKPIAKTDEDTREAVADWHYWGRGVLSFEDRNLG